MKYLYSKYLFFTSVTTVVMLSEHFNIKKLLKFTKMSLSKLIFCIQNIQEPFDIFISNNCWNAIIYPLFLMNTGS